MITYMQENIFDSKAQTLVNPVNTVGIMGRGLALQFRRRYPDMYARYSRVCRKELLEVGQLLLYKYGPPCKWVLCFPTKRDWRCPSRMEYIEAGLKKFTATYSAHRIDSIAFPPLGCGNGGLDWKTQVQPLMERYLGDLPIDIYIYPPITK